MTTKLKDLRNARGVSLAGLSKASGVAIRSVERLDSGQSSINNAPFDTVYSLAFALGVQPTDIVDELPRAERAEKRRRALPEKFKNKES